MLSIVGLFVSLFVALAAAGIAVNNPGGWVWIPFLVLSGFFFLVSMGIGEKMSRREERTDYQFKE